ncbi:hypothetical protein [Metabacillus fastidiosus]|uniref:hypothetical protein n=1 Tax=Metabacillus fastidiosus TaxID=1458 RepID=UPI003D2D9E5F
MKEKLSLKPKIIELNNSNDIYMTLNICILSNDVNYNKAQFMDDFIDGVIENKETYIGIPFVVNREKLESAEYENLTHELQDGELLTDQVGSFVDFWKEEIDDANCLMGSIKVMKRFPNTCAAIVELYNNDDLETSCEVLVNSYVEITEDGIRKIGYNEGKNALIGSAIVTSPAEKRAKATLLVAEAYEKDINQGGESMSEKFNKGHEIKYHGQFETASLKFSEVSNQIYNKLNPLNAKNNSRTYNYYILDLYTDFVICEDWDDYETLYKIPYSIESDEVVLSPQEQWIKGALGFIPDNVNLDQLQSQVTELNNKLEELKKEAELQMSKTVEELETEVSAKNKEIAEFTTKLEDLEKKVTELNETIVSQESTKKELEDKVTELNSAIEELGKYKEQVETAEKEKAVAELNSKYSKLLSEEVFKSERVQEAIQELNSVELNSIVVEEIDKQKVTETASTKKDDTVTIVASKQEDLIKQSIAQKYGINA